MPLHTTRGLHLSDKEYSELLHVVSIDTRFREFMDNVRIFDLTKDDVLKLKQFVETLGFEANKVTEEDAKNIKEDLYRLKSLEK